MIKKSKSPYHLTQTSILNDLLCHHGEFQEYLDVVSASNIEMELVEILIQIRQFNINCISKYTDLISQERVYIKATSSNLSASQNPSYNDQYVLSMINTKLSLLLPAYTRALSDKSLIGFARIIIANNYEKILHIKDNLLHPLPELQNA